jgi:hypothetical protein
MPETHPPSGAVHRGPDHFVRDTRPHSIPASITAMISASYILGAGGHIVEHIAQILVHRDHMREPRTSRPTDSGS